MRTVREPAWRPFRSVDGLYSRGYIFILISMHAGAVVFGLLGPVLDAGQGPARWQAWRPTVAIGQHQDLIVDRFELLYEPRFERLCDQVVADLAAVSPETEVRRHPMPFDDPWDFEGVYGALHDFARRYEFHTDDEEYLVHITTGTHVAQICLFLLTESHYFPARLLQTSPPGRGDDGPGDYRVIDLDLSRYDTLTSRFAQEQRESHSLLKSGIETRNAGFNRLIEQIERVAAHSRAPLLLTGPTGAGKSHLARRIFEFKRMHRQISGSCVEVNCATLRGDAAMSTLFGHRKGAFTGAVHDRPGLLRAASEGVLFLDEIGELGLDEQAMLLHAIEEKRFMPVGSDREVQSDFQLIAGTNCDLVSAVRTGAFREDLLARINLWAFELPALRDRPEDIEPNLTYELEQYARVSGENVRFNKEARQRFVQFAVSSDAHWHGNFRDLNAAVIRMATFAAGGRITVQIVEAEIDRLRRSWGPAAAGQHATSLDDVLPLEELARIDPFDRVQLAEVIRVCRNSRTLSEAGRRLFAASRQTKRNANDADRLRKYLARFNIDWRTLRPEVPS